MNYYVQIIERKTKKVIKQIECSSVRQAVGVEGGVNINLNHDGYYTEIHQKPSKDCEVSK